MEANRMQHVSLDRPGDGASEQIRLRGVRNNESVPYPRDQPDTVLVAVRVHLPLLLSVKKRICMRNVSSAAGNTRSMDPVQALTMVLPAKMANQLVAKGHTNKQSM